MVAVAQVLAEEPGEMIVNEKPMKSAGSEMEPAALRIRGRVPWILLAVGLLLPSAITWVYFVALAEQSSGLQQLAYGLGKGAQFLLPIVAVGFWGEWKRGMLPAVPESDAGREHDVSVGGIRQSTRTGLVVGTSDGGERKGRVANFRREWLIAILLGCVVSLVMMVLYFAFLLPGGGMELAKQEGMAKLEALGIGSPAALLLLAAFYAFLHSGFEEFYWRGFVFQGLRQYSTLPVAGIVSSLGFMAHHVLVLGKFFGYDSPETYFFSISIAVGGGAWAWIVSRTGSLVPSWISHGIIDAAIFLIALHLIFFAS